MQFLTFTSFQLNNRLLFDQYIDQFQALKLFSLALPGHWHKVINSHGPSKKAIRLGFQLKHQHVEALYI